MRVLFTDGFDMSACEILKQAGIETEFYSSHMTEEELLDALPKFNALGVRGKTRVSTRIFEEAKNILAIGRAGSGVDNIALEYATRSCVAVFNAPGANANAVAELTIFHVIGLARKARTAIVGISHNIWEKNNCDGTEIAGKTLGIVGCGHIGSLVAKKARALGMKVRVYDPNAEKEIEGVEQAEDVARVLESDFITLHIPQSANFILNEASLGSCPRGACIINLSRGNLADIDAINARLRDGRLGGYAADVYSAEPPDFSHPIFSAPNTLFTPHIGAKTREAETKCAEMVARQLRDFLLFGNIENSVNFPRVVIKKTALCRLTLFHLDREGILAKITAMLSEHKYNIACLENQRTDRGQIAYTIIDMDSDADSISEQIKNIDGIIRVRMIP